MSMNIILLFKPINLFHARSRMVRKKNRYVLAELVYEENNKVYPLTNSQLYQAIRSAFKTCFGDYGIALVKASLSVSSTIWTMIISTGEIG